MKRNQIILLTLLLSVGNVSAQVTPLPKADATVVFSLGAEGKRFEPTWGLDQAWISEQNLRKGINHMGLENIGVGRSAFRTKMALTDDSVLTSDHINYLRQRSNIFNIVSTTLPIIFTADQEAGSDSYFVVNKVANVDHWSANINSHVDWMQRNTGHPVIAVSPFNEPDYWTKEEGATASIEAQVARKLKEEYPRFTDIAIVGSNTLNNDKAWSWFTPGQDYYEWGNTHQLAGSMDSYASFHQRLADLGRVGYNDEMHNVAEAMVGLEYGMTVGIWWGFDSRARGEFCDISRHGERIAYGEHRANWTAASVWRHDDGRVKAFIGSSERQAFTTKWQFVSPETAVYFDGHGPLRAWSIEIPGGTAYQVGQTNAERVVDITWGDDVPPTSIDEGVYKIVNKATGCVVALVGNTIAQQKWSSQARQKWTVKPCSPRIGGDFSFYDIESETNHRVRINLENFSTSSDANLIGYEQDSPTSNEQWYLEYAGGGWYYIRNRESALYMATASKAPVSGVKILQSGKLTGTDADRSLWRLLPVDVEYDDTPPAAPKSLTAQPRPASIKLQWDGVSVSDQNGYFILRADASHPDCFNTIARMVQGTTYVDNTVQPGITYIYKVKAIDHSLNLSEPSDEIQCTPEDKPDMIAHWTFEGNIDDATVNTMHAISGTSESLEYVDDCKQGASALRLIGTREQYLQLPSDVAVSEELTVAMWVDLLSNSSWQRLFDFGNDTGHYLFLTPTNGTSMRFAIKNGGEEQVLDAPRVPLDLAWHHVAVTIGRGGVAIYLDGEQVAFSSAITLRPTDVHPVLNYLGRSQFNADPFFTGYLDDGCIYNYALSADEVKRAMDGEVDGIRETAVGDHRGTTYDLGGRRVGKVPTGGLRIINKKKVIK